MSDDLAEFLRARLDEREALAHEVQAVLDSGWNYFDETPTKLIDPARELREVEAKRKIVDAYEAAVTRQNAAAEGRADEEPEWHIARRMALHFACAVNAAVYSEHPGYRRQWQR